MLMGTYEKACKPWSPKETPWDFGHELLPEDIDRIAPSLEVGFEHFPAFQKAGIKQIINGPFTFAPDGNPLIGPIKGLRGYWCACGVMAGFSQGGGVGFALSNWMIEGDPRIVYLAKLAISIMPTAVRTALTSSATCSKSVDLRQENSSTTPSGANHNACSSP